MWSECYHSVYIQQHSPYCRWGPCFRCWPAALCPCLCAGCTSRAAVWPFRRSSRPAASSVNSNTTLLHCRNILTHPENLHVPRWVALSAASVQSSAPFRRSADPFPASGRDSGAAPSRRSMPPKIRRPALRQSPTWPASWRPCRVSCAGSPLCTCAAGVSIRRRWPWTLAGRWSAGCCCS